MREHHVRFYEGLGVKFPKSTRQCHKFFLPDDDKKIVDHVTQLESFTEFFPG